VFDVVSPSVHGFYVFEELRQSVDFVDILVVYSRSLARFFGRAPDSDPNDIVCDFRDTFSPSLGILRYGERNIRLNRFVCGAADVLTETNDSSRNLSAAGYGDRLMFNQVLTLLNSPEKYRIPRSALAWFQR